MRDSGLLFLVIICHQAAFSPTIPCPQNALVASAAFRKLSARVGPGGWRSARLIKEAEWMVRYGYP